MWDRDRDGDLGFCMASRFPGNTVPPNWSRRNWGEEWKEDELSAKLTPPDVQGPLLSFSCAATHLDAGVNLSENKEAGPECSSGTPGSQMKTMIELPLWVYVFCLRSPSSVSLNMGLYWKLATQVISVPPHALYPNPHMSDRIGILSLKDFVSLLCSKPSAS